MPDGNGTPVHRGHHAIRSRGTWRGVGPRSVPAGTAEAQAHLQAGSACLQQSQWAKAADAFEQAAALHPLAAETYVQWGMAPAQLKRYQEAIGKFAQAVALNPQEAMAYNTGALHSANWTVIRRPLSSSSRP